MAGDLVFDHLHLDAVDRRLIEKACAGGCVVYLAPLDKGLSGSSVWQARWRLQAGPQSKYHVFKIGAKKKLEREDAAIKTIASVVEPGFPYVAYFPDDKEDRGLLRQEFVGQGTEATISLRGYIEQCASPDKAQTILLKLYQDRMQYWHPTNIDPPVLKLKLGDALDWWVSRLDINSSAKQIGAAGLEASLQKRCKVNLAALRGEIDAILAREEELAIGPVHGDLHSQNVLIDKAENMQLIDFGCACLASPEPH